MNLLELKLLLDGFQKEASMIIDAKRAIIVEKMNILVVDFINSSKEIEVCLKNKIQNIMKNALEAEITNEEYSTATSTPISIHEQSRKQTNSLSNVYNSAREENVSELFHSGTRATSTPISITEQKTKLTSRSSNDGYNFAREDNLLCSSSSSNLPESLHSRTRATSTPTSIAVQRNEQKTRSSNDVYDFTTEEGNLPSLNSNVMEENSRTSIHQDSTEQKRIKSNSNVPISSQFNMEVNHAVNNQDNIDPFAVDPFTIDPKQKVNLSNKKKEGRTRKSRMKRMNHLKCRKNPGNSSSFVKYGMIKSIVDKRIHKGIIQYRVHWDGTEIWQSTWEPKETLEKDAPEFIERLETAQKHTDEPGKIHCICKGIDNGDCLIQCIICQGWFHPTCVNVDVINITKKEMQKKRWRCNKCNRQEINEIVDLAVEDE